MHEITTSWLFLSVAAVLISVACTFSIIPLRYSSTNSCEHSCQSHARLNGSWRWMPCLRATPNGGGSIAGRDAGGGGDDAEGSLIEDWRFKSDQKAEDFEGGTAYGAPFPKCEKEYFPYSRSSFKRIRRSKQFWKDNTRHIAYTVENEIDHQMFLRPPRWGKSLFIDMLDSYLDIKAAGDFDELFGGTEIHGMKRQHNNKYHVMRFDLGIDIGDGDPAFIRKQLYDRIDNVVNRFCRRYGINQSELGSYNALENFKASVEFVADEGGEVFILIDEYDRFANELMFEKPDQIVAGKSSDPTFSPVRAFYQTIKSLPQVRSFTVGISPIALADASGVNFISDISEEGAVGDLVGLTEDDARSALTQIFGSNVDIEPLVDLMRQFYNGYHFKSLTGVTFPLYHTQLCLYFWQKLCTDPDFGDRAFAGKVTVGEMMDKNTGVSENVIDLLIRQSELAGIVSNLAAGYSIPAVIIPSFKLREMLSERTSSANLLISFMRWHGLVTASYDGAGYVIPNQVVGDAKGLLNKVAAALGEMEYNVRAMINDPSDQKVWEFHQRLFEKMRTRLDNSYGETGVVGSVESMLLTQAEREGFGMIVEAAVPGGRADLLLIEHATERILLLEYKRLRPGNAEKENDLCWPGNKKAQLFRTNSVSDANTQLLRCEISASKRQFHQHQSSVQGLLNLAQVQVSEYFDQLSQTGVFSGFQCTRGVVIHATTDAPQAVPPFTTVVGVWLQPAAVVGRVEQTMEARSGRYDRGYDR